MALGRDIDVPNCMPSLLIELAFHHSDYLGQPDVTGVLSAKDQGEVGLVSLGTAKAITSAVESDPSSIRGFNESHGIEGAKVETLRH